MPFLSQLPNPGHDAWMGPLYRALIKAIGYVVPSGASGIPSMVRLGEGIPTVAVGNATGSLGWYGTTGIPKSLAVGLGNTGGTTGVASGAYALRSNGGTGTNFYTLDDLVAIGKMNGSLTV